MHYLFDFKHDLNIYILNICEYYVTEMYIMYTCMLFILLSVCLSVCLSIVNMCFWVYNYFVFDCFCCFVFAGWKKVYCTYSFTFVNKNIRSFGLSYHYLSFLSQRRDQEGWLMGQLARTPVCIGFPVAWLQSATFPAFVTLYVCADA